MVALLAAGFMAASFWHVLMSRLGFRSIAEPFVQALALAALWRGLRLNDRRWLILSGALIGLNLYTYLAARLFPIAIALLFLYLIAFDRGHRRKRLIQLSLIAAAAIIVFAPLAMYFLQNPDTFFTRINQVALGESGSADLLVNAARALGMFFVEGDPNVRFNLPGRPLFPSLLGILFLIGVLVSAAGMIRRRSSPRAGGDDPTRLRRAAYFFVLASTLVMMLATVLTAPKDITPNNLRAIGMLPLVFVFPALGVWMIVRWLLNIGRKTKDQGRMFVLGPSSLVLGLILIVTLSAVETGQAYFGQYVRLPQLYYDGDGDLVDIAQRLNQVDATRTPIYVHAQHYRHPTLAALARDFYAIKSITGPDVLVFPPGSSMQVFAHLALPDQEWLDRVLPDSGQVDVAAGPDGQTSYIMVQLDRTPAIGPQVVVDLNYGNTIQLLGYTLEAASRSGGTVDVTLFWRVLNTPDRGDYSSFVELRDAWDFQWGQINSFDYPSEQWGAGEVIVQRLRVPVAAGAPRGEYVLSVGWYSSSANKRLPIVTSNGSFGTAARLGPIAVERAAQPPEENILGIGTRIDAPAMDGLRLLGASLATPGVPQGAPLFFTLFWRADSALPDQPVEIRMRGQQTIPLTTTAPVHNTYPFGEWPPGEVVADRYGLRVPVDAPPGDYVLQARVGPGEWIGAAQVRVEATTRTFDVPPIAHPLEVTFGDQIDLLGYDLDRSEMRAGESVTLTLYWRARKTPDDDYTVFTHLLDASGVQRGGRDNAPVSGTYNTSRWVAGEVIVDTYSIPLEANAPPGEYAIEVGLYQFESGARLPLSTGGDALRLATVRVTP
jgi:hypothetical protein